MLDTNMEAIGRKMVKLCAGLPLAIIVLGGLLATKHTLWEWDSVHQNVRLHKWSDDPIQHDNGVSTVTRCMVQVEVDEFNGRIDYCRIHDLMLELCLSKAKMNDFLGIIHLQRETDLANCFSTTTSTTAAPKIRKLAIHLNRDVERVVLPELETTKHLRSLLFCKSRSVIEASSIDNLETLEGFDTGSCDVNDLCKLINLRQLEDATFWKKHNQDLAAFINYLSIGAPHLRQTTLLVEFCKKEEEELTVLKQLLGCHHLYRLSINGIIPELPEYCHGFFPNLIKLTLSGCELEEDPMPTLERLPNLQYLYLGSDAFVGDKMLCSANGFPQLKTLSLYQLILLKEWEVEKGAMPNLSNLKIAYCEGLEMVPEGLRFIATLQQFTIKNVCENFNNKLRRVNGEEGEDFYKVRHVSSLNIWVHIEKHQKKNGKWKKKILEGR
ncbi:unnamed protein product [Camellia sinensis]